LIARGRLVFQGAHKRFDVFELVNGKISARDIARKTGRPFTSVLRDLQKMKDMGLVNIRTDAENSIVKSSGSMVYEKDPLLRHIPKTYFKDPVRAKKRFGKKIKSLKKQARRSALAPLTVPSVTEILNICKTGEDQPYEFKSAGVDTDKLTREIGAFANIKTGGIIFYGIDDDGTISGSDKHRQKMDQSIQNSVRNTISPPINIRIREKDLLGHKILLIIIPPWNRKDVYHYKGRVLIRKGTNVFTGKPDESRKLHRGIFVV